MLVRPIREEDSQAYLDLCHALDRETRFMMLEPGERTTTLEEQRQRIRALQPGQLILVAEEDQRLVGYLGTFSGTFRRNRHSAYIVVGIAQAFTGRGIGRKLFIKMEEWARQQEIHRLELTVMIHNERAVRLYQGLGFAVEGVKKDALKCDGRYVDEFHMAKILDL